MGLDDDAPKEVWFLRREPQSAQVLQIPQLCTVDASGQANVGAGSELGLFLHRGMAVKITRPIVSCKIHINEWMIGWSAMGTDGIIGKQCRKR
jgi:hypothetical protein